LLLLKAHPTKSSRCVDDDAVAGVEVKPRVDEVPVFRDGERLVEGNGVVGERARD
jgi:hypothetical protein